MPVLPKNRLLRIEVTVCYFGKLEVTTARCDNDELTVCAGCR